MAEALCVLIAACFVFGIGAAIEQARRPKVRDDDQPSPSECGLW